MAASDKRGIRSLKGTLRPGLVIVIIAALLVELVSFVQYRSLRSLLLKELDRHSKLEIGLKTEIISHALESAEATLQEHLWDLRQSLPVADSMFGATRRLVESNPHIVGASIAFVPGYYPGQGRLFEPYAKKSADGIQLRQLGSEAHDYTLNPAVIKVLEEKHPLWSDPYEYDDGAVSSLTTYSYPLEDRDGRLAAVCGLDIDLSWLSDTLNAHQFYPSSFGFMLTREGKLVAGPEGRDLGQIVSLINDSTAVRRQGRHSTRLAFYDRARKEKAYVYYSPLQNDPCWQIAQVSYAREVFASLRRLRARNGLLILAGLLALLYMIGVFARNEKKLRDASVRHARIGSELSIARQIQQELLPKPLPPGEGVDIYGALIPAREVGGDLYDYFVRDGQVYFCIGDVSGKGIPSAMVMAIMHAVFRQVAAHEDDPGRIIRSVNEESCRNNDSNMFVTFFLGILDLESGRLRYCNAGHDRPLLISGAGVEELSAQANLPVGAFPSYEFRTQETTLAPGTTLLLYTDGLTEARSPEKEWLGRQGVLDILARSGQEPRQMVESLIEAVRVFVGDAGQGDDLTLLGIQFNNKESKS